MLLAVELQRRAVAEAVEHARALLEPTQQRLPDPLAAALEAALGAWKQNQPEAAREYLEHATESASRLGFL